MRDEEFDGILEALRARRVLSTLPALERLLPFSVAVVADEFGAAAEAMEMVNLLGRTFILRRWGRGEIRRLLAAAGR
jgi:hypothetical protein